MVSSFEGSPMHRELTEYECVKRICSDNDDPKELMLALNGRMYD